MAFNGLNLPVELESGVIVDHWKIGNAQYIKNTDHLFFVVMGYYNKAAYDAGKPHVHEEEVNMTTEYNPLDLADISQEGRNLLIRMYDFLKSPGQFLEGAVDVIE